MEQPDKCQHCAAHRVAFGKAHCDYLNICLDNIQDSNYPPCIK